MAGAAVEIGGPTAADEALLARVYATEIERLVSLGRMLTGDVQAGEDLAHEVFLRAARQLSREPGFLREPAWPWLRTALVHAALDRKRQMMRELKRMVHVALDHDDASWSDATLDLARAVRQLTPKMRACVVLHYAQDMSLDQVGEAVGIGVRTVETHLHRARERLAISLADLDPRIGSHTQERP